jgi:biotin carboxylase
MASDRARFARHAETLGLRIPPTRRVDSVAMLRAWLDEHGVPAVLKRDASWGGLGVAFIRNKEHAAREFERLSRPATLPQALRRLLLDRDWLPMLDRAKTGDRHLVVQRFVAGTPANRAIACQQGRVLGGISVRAVQTQHATGPATVIEAIDHPEMTRAAAAFARDFRLSGLWGFDFILDEADAAWLLEINPRATPVCHLPLGVGRDLMTALARIGGAEAPLARPHIRQSRIALFPGEWQRDAESPHLVGAHHDVPWEERGLIADGLAPPWPERGWIARSVATLRKRRRLRRAAFPSPPGPARADA